MCALARDEATIALGLSSLRPTHTSCVAANDLRRGTASVALGSAAVLSRAGADAASVLNVNKNEKKLLQAFVDHAYRTSVGVPEDSLASQDPKVFAKYTADLTIAEVTFKTVAAHKAGSLAFDINCAKWSAYLVAHGVPLASVVKELGSVLKAEYEAIVASKDPEEVASKERACLAGDDVVKMIALRQAAWCARVAARVARQREADDLADCADSDEDMIDMTVDTEDTTLRDAAAERARKASVAALSPHTVARAALRSAKAAELCAARRAFASMRGHSKRRRLTFGTDVATEGLRLLRLIADLEEWQDTNTTVDERAEASRPHDVVRALLVKQQEELRRREAALQAQTLQINTTRAAILAVVLADDDSDDEGDFGSVEPAPGVAALNAARRTLRNRKQDLLVLLDTDRFAASGVVQAAVVSSIDRAKKAHFVAISEMAEVATAMGALKYGLPPPESAERPHTPRMYSVVLGACRWRQKWCWWSCLSFRHFW